MIGSLALQRLQPHLTELARFESTEDLKNSSVYRKVQSELESILNSVWQEEFVHPAVAARESVSAVAWNIERGMRLDSVIDLLRNDPRLCSAEVLFLSELDWGMARTGNRFVAREIASALG